MTDGSNARRPRSGGQISWTSGGDGKLGTMSKLVLPPSPRKSRRQAASGPNSACRPDLIADSSPTTAGPWAPGGAAQRISGWHSSAWKFQPESTFVMMALGNRIRRVPT